MDKKEKPASSDDEHFEDANEKVVNELIEEVTGFNIDEINQNKENHDNDSEEEDGDDSVEKDDKFEDCEFHDFIDDELQKKDEEGQTEEEREAARLKANELKQQANELFKQAEYTKSLEIYTEALKTCPVACTSDRAILYGNRAASKMKLDSIPSAIDDCTKALEFNPDYVRVLLRRAAIYEETDKLDESFADFKKALELDPDNAEARAASVRLPPRIDERNERMKAEMIDKLKDLGNMILRPFGLSTSNFQMQQDPATGSYSINFNQNNNANT